MTCKVGIVSDIHAYPSPLEEALRLFKQQKVNIILCPGDIAGYGDRLEETVALLTANQCLSVVGNHEFWYLEQVTNQDARSAAYFTSLPRHLELTLEHKKLYMVHASPPDSFMDGIRLLDQNEQMVTEQKQLWTSYLADFEHDILIVGHTHQVFAEQLANTLVINPGSTQYNHSCAILNLPAMTVEFYPLSSKKIIKTWNWGSNQLESSNN